MSLNDDETYIGYRFGPDGKHDGKHWMKGPREAWSFALQYMHSYPHVMITDGGDFCVLEAENGEITFPPEAVTALVEGKQCKSK